MSPLLCACIRNMHHTQILQNNLLSLTHTHTHTDFTVSVCRSLTAHVEPLFKNTFTSYTARTHTHTHTHTHTIELSHTHTQTRTLLHSCGGREDGIHPHTH